MSSLTFVAGAWASRVLRSVGPTPGSRNDHRSVAEGYARLMNAKGGAYSAVRLDFVGSPFGPRPKPAG